jgi:hypothetical protein
MTILKLRRYSHEHNTGVLRQMTPIQHVHEVRSWQLRWAWPADGRQQTLAGAGIPLARQYVDAGLDMCTEKATFEDGGVWVVAVIAAMHDRLRGGRWKVFKGQNDAWLEEYRLYHRRDGLIVKEADDAISASRYALMMLRRGQSQHGVNQFNREIAYPQVSFV